MPIIQRAAAWLQDKAFGTPTPEPVGLPLPVPIDSSATMRDQLFARLEQFAQQRREERRATQEKPVSAPEATHDLPQAREQRQERAADFWQQTLVAGRDAQPRANQQATTEKPRQPRQL